MIIACDLGGTKSIWALYDTNAFKGANRPDFLYSERYENSDGFAEFIDVLYEFTANIIGKGYDITDCRKIVISVAGEVDKDLGTAKMTRYHFQLNVSDIEQELRNGFGLANVQCHLLNDFEGVGWGIIALNKYGLKEDDFESIIGPDPISIGRNRVRLRGGQVGSGLRFKGERSLICGPGTGLGVACLVDGLEKDGLPFIISSEGGHFTIAPESDRLYKLMGGFDTAHGEHTAAFEQKFTFEHILSGHGIEGLYHRLRSRAKMPDSDIKAPEIMARANIADNQDAQALLTKEIFGEVLAGFCGNMCNTFNIDKAIYLWGSALDSLSPVFLKARFNEHFANRQHASRLERIPVVRISNKLTPVLGSAFFGYSQLQKSSRE